MPEGPTIADTSCLIGLEAIGCLDLLKRLYGTILIPNAVALEWGSLLPDSIKVEVVTNRSFVSSLGDRLGAGEAEVIALALECGACRIILDDKQARRTAQKYQLPLTGTVGVILRAKDRGLLSAVKPVLGELRQSGFAISDGLLAEAIHLAGE